MIACASNCRGLIDVVILISALVALSAHKQKDKKNIFVMNLDKLMAHSRERNITTVLSYNIELVGETAATFLFLSLPIEILWAAHQPQIPNYFLQPMA
ncbi:MAG: hypothetical protein Ct9H300mP22_4210 [Gammaproteobacteria bacterium]|nr:MAG: hypothetical protein Ct9H300mP22_4210 [Gammaproteobacteria bacterium]